MLRSNAGQAFIETAIGVLVILGATWAVIDAGALFWTYMTLENAVTQATRYAVTQQTISGLNRVDSIKSILRQQAPGITIPDGEITFLNITNNSADPGGPNDLIRISVQHVHAPLLPSPLAIFRSEFGRTFRINVSAMMANEPPD